MTLTQLTPEQRLYLDASLREAVYHLCNCWNALGEVEAVLEDVEVETDDIQALAGDCGHAEDAYRIPAENLDALLEGLTKEE